MTGVPRIERTDQFLGQVLEGRYRVTERLGEGGMGAVYRAQQVGGGPDVALKVLKDELIHDTSQRERFEREARALFALEHPNVLRVHDYGVVNGLPFLVMELLQGESLDKMLERGPLAPDEALACMEQVLTGLAVAHSQGVLHRDLKTENVFVTRGNDGRPVAKLLDFGLVKFVDDERWGSGKVLTKYGEVFGTPAYMAPEQCTGAPVDARTDVYALGVVLYELLTGQWPFMEETRVEMMRAHLMQPPAPLASVRTELVPRPELEAVVIRALAKDPAERFADAGAMLAALRAVPRPAATLAVSGLPGSTYPVPFGASFAAGPSTPGYMATGATAPGPSPTKRSSMPWLLIGGVLAVSMLVVVAAVILLFVLR